MSKSTHLPARWRESSEIAHHAETIADILDTPPLPAQAGSLVLFAEIGAAQVLPFLVAVKSFATHLGRGRVVLLDDGSLTAQDRAILAHHCGDPEIIAAHEVTLDTFPDGPGWKQFLTILDRRAREYWISLDCFSVTTGPVPEISAAIARNRSFFCLADAGQARPQPLASVSTPASGDDIAARIEAQLAENGAKGGWLYARTAAGLAGFCALGADRALAKAFLAATGKRLGKENAILRDAAQIAVNFHLANENEAEILPPDRYFSYTGEDWPEEAAFAQFPAQHRYSDSAYIDASRRAIEALRR